MDAPEDEGKKEGPRRQGDDDGTGNKTGKQGRNSDNENGTRTMIASSEQEDSRRGDPGLGFGRWHNGAGTWAERGSGTEIRTGI